jgi:glycosyltransferase involved in cell wall biosynthesis
MPRVTPRPIAIATPRYAPDIGGVEKHVEELARGLVARGVPIEVLACDPTGRLPRIERLDGVLVRRFPTLAGDRVFFVSPRLLRWAWHHAERYRLIHAHSYHTLVPLAVAMGARRADVPLVVTPHYHATGHTPLRSLLHVPYRPVAGRVLHGAASVIAVSAVERGWLERDFGDLPLHVLPNGVDLRLPEVDETTDHVTLDRAPGEVTLLTVGRLEAYKGAERIVTALPHLPPEVRLTIIGTGPAAEAIRATAERLGVADRVRMPGHVSVSELAAWYGAADLFVTLSREEAFGMTVLEAAGSGAPVLASSIPAHREVAGYVVSGRIALVEPSIEGRPLAATIRDALAAGRSTDRTGWRMPTWNAMVDGVLDVYAEVLDEPVV